MIYWISLALILISSKLGLIRPWMRRKNRAGDYFYGERATFRDFAISLMPQNELQIHRLVVGFLTVGLMAESFPFRILLTPLPPIVFLICWLFFFMFVFQTLSLIWIILRCDLFFKTQIAALLLGTAAQLISFTVTYQTQNELHFSKLPLVFAFWIFLLSVSNRRAQCEFFPLSTSRVMRPKGFPPRKPGKNRILFINPSSGLESSPFSERNSTYPSILPMVAATLPPDWDVMLLDEVHDEIDFDIDVDIVGITTMAFFARNAKEMASEFKKRGKTVIFGGPDVTQNQDFYMDLGSSVLVGEAFDFLPTMLEDWKNGVLRKKYVNPKQHSLAGLPLPRNDLLPLRRYRNIQNILVSTSCPFACEFCTYAKDRAARLRPPEELVAAIRHTPAKIFWFEAPELLIYKPYIRKLETHLKDLNIEWSTHGSLKSCSDPENLRAARAAGLRQVFLGVESFSQESLKFVNKKTNVVSKYLETFQLLDRVGISVLAHLMFGFPQETEEDRNLGLKILNEGKIAKVLPHPLGVFPGTDAFEKKLIDNGAEEVSVFKELNVTEGLHYRYYRPKNISDLEYANQIKGFLHSFLSFRSVFRRIFFRSYRNLPNLLPDLISNLVMKFEGESNYGCKMDLMDHFDLLFRLEKGTAHKLAKALEKDVSPERDSAEAIAIHKTTLPQKFPSADC